MRPALLAKIGAAPKGRGLFAGAMPSKQQQADTAYCYATRRLVAACPDRRSGLDGLAFQARLTANFPILCDVLAEFYAERPDFLDQLSEVLLAERSWRARPQALKAHDAARDDACGWFQSNAMIGGVDRVLLLYAVAMSAGGVPPIYLGDEVGQLNDCGYRDNPGRARRGLLGAPASMPR